jgi:hypothetical protein
MGLRVRPGNKAPVFTMAVTFFTPPQVRSNVKKMLIVFYNIQDLVHYEFVAGGQTVNQHYYNEVLLRLREKVRRQRSHLFQNGRWLLHHDNASAHTALSIQEFLAEKKKFRGTPYPYSPHLAHCKVFLFPSIKMNLKGRRFDDVDTVKINTTRELNSLSRADLQRCFLKWQERWDKNVSAVGNYFEGNN